MSEAGAAEHPALPTEGCFPSKSSPTKNSRSQIHSCGGRKEAEGRSSNRKKYTNPCGHWWELEVQREPSPRIRDCSSHLRTVLKPAHDHPGSQEEIRGGISKPGIPVHVFVPPCPPAFEGPPADIHICIPFSPLSRRAQIRLPAVTHHSGEMDLLPEKKS